MCPGVVSDWPGKCPVCNMALVRRVKGEMTPLPDGVIARMQFSPYRVQLAGIHTSPIEYRRLTRDVVLAGLLERSDAKNAGSKFVLPADVAENDLELIQPGRSVDVQADAFPGRVFAAKIARIAPQLNAGSRSARVQLEIEDPDRGLLPGMYASGMLRVRLADLEIQQHLDDVSWRDSAATTIAAASIFTQPQEMALVPLLEAAVAKTAQAQGFVLAVPESAVVDTGIRKTVYIQQSPGSFDCVELTLGRRCEGWYQVLGGVQSGQAVVTAGAFLLDAETRLNPSSAAAYFGAAGRSSSNAQTTAAPPPGAPSAPANSSELSSEDQRIIAEQQVCPVTGAKLGSMGAPKRVVVEGRVVFVCCDGCTSKLQKDPAKYLAKLPNK